MNSCRNRLPEWPGPPGSWGAMGVGGKEAPHSISKSVTKNPSIFAGRWLTAFLLLADR